MTPKEIPVRVCVWEGMLGVGASGSVGKIVDNLKTGGGMLMLEAILVLTCFWINRGSCLIKIRKILLNY
jgi:hypothetical protein